MQHQYRALHRTLPVLHAVSLLNFIIVAYALRSDGHPLWTYGWIAAPALLSLLRIAQWRQRDEARVELAQAQRWLSSVQLLLAIVMGVTSVFAAWTAFSRFFSSVLLVPISLTFGALCLSHAMGSLPRAAVSSVLGIVPPAISLIIFGDGQIKLIGVSALSVVVLQIVFLRSGYAALIELLRLQKRLAELASYDSLTGLLSRRALLHAVQERVAKNADFTLALVDLDGFKAVNDTHGHAMGDALLRAVSQRFMKCGDAVGRLGGDEFVLLIDGGAAPEASMEKILEAARQPVEADGATLHVSASVGYASFPLDGKDPSTLMRVADEAMYSAKNSGKARAMRKTR